MYSDRGTLNPLSYYRTSEYLSFIIKTLFTRVKILFVTICSFVFCKDVTTLCLVM